MLQLNDSVSAFKAATGPNPQGHGQTAKNTTGYRDTTGAPVNQGVRAAGPSQQPAPVPLGSPPAFDYSTDPILVQIMGQQQMAIQQAQDAALAQKKAALIAYGDPGLAMSILGDKLTADAAANNPGSTLASLAAQNKQNVRGINEAENKQNLWYSSDAGYKLGLNQKAYLASQAGAAGDVQGKLGSIGTQLLAAEQAAYQAESQAQTDAYNRALANPQLGATGSGGGGDNGGGGDQTPEVAQTPGAAPAATAATRAVGNVAGDIKNVLGGMFGSSKPKSGYAPGGAIRT